MASVQVGLQTGRLRFVAGLPGLDVLLQELEGLSVKLLESGCETFGAWREGAHDDLVLALALAVWYAGQVGESAESYLR